MLEEEHQKLRYECFLVLTKSEEKTHTTYLFKSSIGMDHLHKKKSTVMDRKQGSFWFSFFMDAYAREKGDFSLFDLLMSWWGLYEFGI